MMTESIFFTLLQTLLHSPPYSTGTLGLSDYGTTLKSNTVVPIQVLKTVCAVLEKKYVAPKSRRLSFSIHTVAEPIAMYDWKFS